MFLLSVKDVHYSFGGLMYVDHMIIHLCNPYIRVFTDALIRSEVITRFFGITLGSGKITLLENYNRNNLTLKYLE